MTNELFVETVLKLRKWIERADKVDEVTGTNWTESWIVELFDLFWDILIPGANDYIFEDFGRLIFEEDVTELDIEDFWNEYKESLD